MHCPPHVVSKDLLKEVTWTHGLEVAIIAMVYPLEYRRAHYMVHQTLELVKGDEGTDINLGEVERPSRGPRPRPAPATTRARPTLMTEMPR